MINDFVVMSFVSVIFKADGNVHIYYIIFYGQSLILKYNTDIGGGHHFVLIGSIMFKLI